MGGKRYPKPPVVEVICELKFTNDGKWDYSIPGILYERRLKEKFPIRDQQIDFTINVSPVTPGRLQQTIEFASPKIIFKSEDKKTVVQILPNSIVINRLQPYIGWQNFRVLIKDVLSGYIEVADPQALEMVALRYVNKFSFQGESIKFNKLFKFYPTVPEVFPRKLRNFISGIESPLDENEVLSVTLRGNVKKEVNIFLGLSYEIHSKITPEMEEIEKIIDKAHDWIEKVFEESITEELRKTFY